MTHQIHELNVLEKLMKEFFDGNIDNQKRQEIEGLLTNFRNRHDCWKLCFEYLEYTKCQYVIIFCLTTIENTINKQWLCFSGEEKAEIRKLAIAFIMKNHTTQSLCVKTKAVKLAVDIATLDWASHRDFFLDVLNLLLTRDTRYLGLLFLLTISEEVHAPREDLTVERKNEIKTLLLKLMPQIFNILFEFLTDETTLTNQDEGCLLLKVLTHLFSWIPASQVPNALISNIFNLASKTDVGICGRENKEKNETLSTLAIGTLNEMLYRQWIPPQYGQITDHAVELSQAVLLAPLSALPASYLQKFSEFLRLVLGIQFSQSERKLENVSKLLALTLNYTIAQPNLTPGFTSCLDIWLHLLDNPKCKIYNDIFMLLVPEILSKIQFRFRENKSKLSEFENKTLDDDGETEWKKFLRPCIETVIKVAELQPIMTLRSLYEQWVELCQLYEHMFTDILRALQNEDEVMDLLRDLATFTQIMGGLQPMCTAEHWREHTVFWLSRLTLQHLLTLSELAVIIPYHSMSEDLKIYFHKLQAEIMASIKSWCYWLSLVQGEDIAKVFFDDLVSRIINCSIPFLDPTSPVILQHCAAHIASTITNVVRPCRLWEYEAFKCMFSSPLSHLQEEDQYLVQGALVNCLILKWPGDRDQMWDQRTKLLLTYVEALTHPLTSLPLQYCAEFQQTIVTQLRLIRYIINLYKAEGLKTKRLLCVAFQKSIEHALALFPVYVKDPQVNQEILQFFLALLECLQQQVGVSFAQVTVQTFMDTFTRQQLQESLSEENGGGLPQLLQLLDFVIQTPGLSASKLTPMAINLCIDLFEPVLSENSSHAVQESLFQLVYSILVHKWQYFFKYNAEAELRTKEFLCLLKAMGRSFFLPNIDLFRQNLKNIEKLNSKWNLYSKEIFRKELHAQFLTVFLNILITKAHSLVKDEIVAMICNLILVDPDDFFNSFLPRFLDSVESLLPDQKTSLRDNFTKDRDTPSVVQNIHRLINDLNCYQLYNASADH